MSEVEEIHRKLLVDIYLYFDIVSVEYHTFEGCMREFIPWGILNAQKTLLGIFEAMETRGYLGVGNYAILKEIDEKSHNIYVFDMINKADEAIQKAKSGDKSTCGTDDKIVLGNLHAAMAEGRALECTLTDKNLVDISNCIRNGWESLAVYLNIPYVLIEHIKLDHRQSMQKTIYHMLLTWRSREGCNATLTSLLDKMINVPEVMIDWNALQDIFGPVDKSTCGTDDKIVLDAVFRDNAQQRIIYEKAISEGYETDKNIRVIILGDFCQGKSSLVRRLLGKNLQGICSTDGIDILCNYCVNSTTGMWETRDLAKVSPLCRLVQAAREQYTRFSTSSEGYDLILDKQSDTYREYQKEMSKESKTSDNTKAEKLMLCLWDFAGQSVYYATHQLFHSKNAIYLLVFDLSRKLDDIGNDVSYQERCVNAGQCIEFWVNSIHSFVGNEDGTEPPIFLVGTHKNELNHVEAENYFDDVRTLFNGTKALNHIQSEHFAVDNIQEDDPQISKLRKAIEIRAKQMNITNTPLLWIPLEKAIMQQAVTKPIITFNDIIQLNKQLDIPINKNEEIKVFLQFHHEKGTLIYYDEECLSDFIVICPQYLINAYKCIITSGIFCKLQPEWRGPWERLVGEGVLNESLLIYLWKKSEDFLSNKNELVAFLERGRIMSRVFQYKEETREKEYLSYYIIPSMLKIQFSYSDLYAFIEGKQSTLISLVYIFQNSTIVPTVYHRLTAAAIGQWPVIMYEGTKPLIYANVGVYELKGNCAGMIAHKDDKIELRLINLCNEQIDRKEADRFRRFIEMILVLEFGKLRSSNDQFWELYSLAVRCCAEKHKSGRNGLYDKSGSNKWYDIQKLKNDTTINLPCPDFLSHKFSVTKALNEWYLDNSDIEVVPNKRLSEKDCSCLSRAIGGNWKLFAVEELELKQVCIEEIISNHQGSSNMQKYHMLLKWTEQQFDKATLDVLVHALKRANSYVTVEWDCIRNFEIR